MSKKLLFPEDIRAALGRRFDNAWRSWLSEASSFPITLPLGVPTETYVADDAVGVRSWVDAWAGWTGAGLVRWVDRQWGRLGRHRLPASLELASAREIDSIAGQDRRWDTACERFGRVTAAWPLAAATGLARCFDLLVDYADADFDRLLAFLQWVDQHPNSGMYLRQLPIEGLDTKWVESRKGLLSRLLRLLRQGPLDGDFHDLCGLRREPHRLRLMVLCPALRRVAGGLRDIEAPVGELALLALKPSICVIVENLETGLALPDMDGAVAFMKLGNAVGVLDRIPWIADVPALYWGDIDTHGYAILDHARRVIPGLRSILMDETTLLAHRALWGRESTQHPLAELSMLREAETTVFDALRSQRWGSNVRLEQERIGWNIAMAALSAAS
jgi:hypothetical protein